MSYRLNKDCSSYDRTMFIVKYGQNSQRTIVETDHYVVALEPWEYMVGDEVISRKKQWDKEQLKLAKERRCKEASDVAFTQLGDGTITFEFREDAHIEATDGNIGKFGNYALGFLTGVYPEGTMLPWVSKEDTQLALSQADIQTILIGIGAEQTEVWTVKYPYYLQLINACETVEEVNAIVIDYTIEIPVEETPEPTVEEEPQAEEE